MEDHIPYSNKFHKLYLCVEIRNFRKTYEYHTPTLEPSASTIRTIANINKTYTMGVKSYADWVSEWNPVPNLEETKEEA